MHGNVREWCQDHWHNNYEDAPEDVSAWQIDNSNENTDGVVRGGSWMDYPRMCRSAYRAVSHPHNRYLILGFRVSCSALEVLQSGLAGAFEQKHTVLPESIRAKS